MATAALAALALVALRTDAPAPPPAHVLTPSPADRLLLVQPRRGLGLAALHRALAAAGYTLPPTPALAEALRVAVPAGADPRAVARRLAASGLVSDVEPDGRVRATGVPDDPRFVAQADYLDAVHAPTAWLRTTGDPSVVIAVIDSGIDLTHPDLTSRLDYNSKERVNGQDTDHNGCPDDVIGCNFVSLDTADPSCGYTVPPPNALVQDDEGHGSFVAGVAAAAGNNAVGITGVAWNVRILPVKVLDCTATGRIADAAAGIRYAIERGANVINISFGSRRDSIVLRDAVEQALAQGITVVASAGNDGADLVTYPAAYPGVIAVAASGRVVANGIDYTAPAGFSNFGGRVDVFAPGRHLLSTIPQAMCGRRGWFCEDGPYAYATGTSFAAPMVAGAAALILSLHPGLRPPLVRTMLMGSESVSIDSAGLLDIAAAVAHPLYGVGAVGVARGAPGGAPLGPVGPAGATVGPATPLVPLPANTGYGLATPPPDAPDRLPLPPAAP